MIRMTPLLALMACAAPETDALFNRLELSTPVTAADANEIFVETVEAASDEVRIALPVLTDMTLATTRGASVRSPAWLAITTSVWSATTKAWLMRMSSLGQVTSSLRLNSK